MNEGRPKKVEINSNDPEIIALIEHINLKILHGKNDIKDKAAYLESLAEAKNIRLKESELKNKFFGRFKRKQTIFLSKDYIRKIDKFLRDVKDDYDIDIAIVSNFKQKYDPDELGEDNVQAKESNILNLLFKNKPRLKHLEGSEWILFERIGDKDIKDAKWGIAVGRLKFTDFKNYLHLTMNTVYKNINRTYRGIATYDVQRCLFIDLLKIEDSTRSNIILQLSDTDVESQSLFIGHYSFYSPSIAYNRILSKTVVLLKKIETASEEIKNNYLEIGNYDYSSSEYKKISQEIRSFLYSRELNRMSMPQKRISDITDLKIFLDDQKLKRLDPRLTKHFVGTYKVYYKSPYGAIIEDDLSIIFDEDALKLMGIYTHKPDIDKKHSKIWLGQIYINDAKSGVSLELSNEKGKNRKDAEDPILLTFWIPNIKIAFDKSQCYPGVISGLEDESSGPISYVCLAVKNVGIDKFLGVEDDRVKKYFDLQDSWMIQPKEIKFKLDEYK